MTKTGIRRPRRAAGLTALALAAALSAVTPPAYAAPQGRILGTGDPGSVSGSYIVTLKGGTRARSAAGHDVAEAYGARIGHTYSSVLNGYSVTTGERQARELAADARVASVTQDTRVAYDHVQRNPPSWGIDRIDQPDLPLDESYDAPEPEGAGVTVYVIDTGIRATHEDFGSRASSGWDFVEDDATAQDGHGHGTHVAGIIAGTTYGVAKKARVVGVRVLDDAGSGTTAQVIAGIDWVTRNARKPAVANMSLGGFANAQLDAAVRTSIASGVTFAVAAGNDGIAADLYSPARVKEAITVGATDDGDRRAPFSNWGPSLDVFAPGVSITSAWNTSDTAKATHAGTSMATPHVTGAAALRLAAHPGDTPAEVSDALANAAVAGKVTARGIGSPDRLLQVNSP
ncbi:S8 family peptidase [Streptomyces sp. CRN 30]|uniref:S8 family peptidase n=1 Tax=Streptomyces sp. CRN 30 TaxID=3075613 RepID=UPI002A815DEF|nr:S8 family peptidase [Streptomyces sp. CRN 30]